MKRILIKNVRVFDPGAGIDHKGRHVLIDGAMLASLDAPRDTTADQVIDGQGQLLCPGFIDLRTHLGEPGKSRGETIATGIMAAAAGGYTTVVAMPNTEPTIDRVEVVRLIQSKAKEAKGARVLPAAALSVGRKGERMTEMVKLMDAGCVLFTDVDRSIKDSQLLRYAMETAYDLGAPIATHAEDESLSLGGVMNEGAVSVRLGLSGAPAEAEIVGVSRDLAMAELTGARLHLGHISTAGAIDLIRAAKSRGVSVTAEVSPLHLTLSEEAVLGYNTQAKVYPPLRTRKDVKAMIQGLSDGTIDAVATDHLGQTAMDKNVEFDNAAAGAVGLESTLGIVLSLVKQGFLTLHRAIAVLTRGPATILNRRDLGRIIEGAPADLTLIDPDQSWMFMRRGLHSKCENSPLFGQNLCGKVKATIVDGDLVYQAEQEVRG